MRTDIIYGTKDEESGLGQFVELFMFDEDNRIGIEWANENHSMIFHAVIKDRDDYEDFRNELVSIFKGCEDIGEVYYELENYLSSEYVEDFLDMELEDED